MLLKVIRVGKEVIGIDLFANSSHVKANPPYSHYWIYNTE